MMIDDFRLIKMKKKREDFKIFNYNPHIFIKDMIK